jgi:hypothetical protein
METKNYVRCAEPALSRCRCSVLRRHNRVCRHSAALCINGAHASARGATGCAFGFSLSVACLPVARRSHPRRHGCGAAAVQGRGGAKAGSLAHLPAARYRCSGSVCLSVYVHLAPRRVRDLRGAAARIAAPRRAAPRLCVCAPRTRAGLPRAQCPSPDFSLVMLFSLRLGCGLRLLRVGPARPSCCDARAVLRCADTAAAGFCFRRCAASLWMRAVGQHAAAPRRVQRPRRVRRAAGGARRKRGSN